MRKLVRVYEIGDQEPNDVFTHQPDYQPQPGETVAVRDHDNECWFIREFAGFLKIGEGIQKVLAYSTAGNQVCVKWNQLSPITQNEQSEPELTFESVVKTLLEANVVTNVEYHIQSRTVRFNSTDPVDTLKQVLDGVNMEKIRATALAKLTEVERKALGL